MSPAVKHSASQSIKAGPSRKGLPLPPFIPFQEVTTAELADACLGGLHERMRAIDLEISARLEVRVPSAS
jgi:hypothetical protein